MNKVKKHMTELFTYLHNLILSFAVDHRLCCNSLKQEKIGLQVYGYKLKLTV